MYRVSTSQKENVEIFKQIFANHSPVLYRDVSALNKGIEATLIFQDGLVSSKIINESLVQAILFCEKRKVEKAQEVIREVLYAGECRIVQTIQDGVYAVLAGDCVVIVDGLRELIVVDTKGFDSRSITEPGAEKVLRGPKEGFNEVLMNNISMIRRRLQIASLKVETMYLDSAVHQQIALCYREDLVNRVDLQTMRERLKKVQFKDSFDTNTLAERINDAPYSLFQTMGISERADVICSKINDGRIVIVVDGSCEVVWAPYVFWENFHTGDDYYLNFYYASLSRLLRFFGYILSILMPALFVGLMKSHKELLPLSTLMRFMEEQSGGIFSLFSEALILIIGFELLREATMRGPTQLSQTLGVVSAIVFGDALINANIISSFMLVIVAFSSMCSLMDLRLKSSIFILKIFLLIISEIWGMIGLLWGIFGILIYMYTLSSLSIPYMHAIVSKKGWDGLLRVPSFLIKR